MNILVTGANGFVGHALIKKLLDEGHHVTALVRSKSKMRKKSKHLKLIEGDLLIRESLPVIENIDSAYYLVHGLKGDEKKFEYQESLAAVNFVHWIRPLNAKVIYLGGLGSENKPLSPHLRSRHMTGSILGSSGLSVIEFRASIILGEGSLSFEMIKAMVERIPFRPDFSLLNQPCQPLALENLLEYLIAALDLSPSGHKIIEIGGPDISSYGELLELYAELSNVRRIKIKIPEVESKVLMKVLDYSIPEHSDAGKKLAESLEHATIVTTNDAATLFPDIKPLGLKEAMEKARTRSKTYYPPLWEKEFLKTLLTDKILTQSGLLSPDLLRNLDKVGKLRQIFSRK